MTKIKPLCRQARGPLNIVEHMRAFFPRHRGRAQYVPAPKGWNYV